MDELTLNTLVPKMTKPTYDKVSPLHTIKKKTKTKSPAVSVPQLKKKADLSAEQLLLTLMDEVKSLKNKSKAAFVNGLKHYLISINQLCDANYEPYSTRMMKLSLFLLEEEMSMSLICYLSIKKAMLVSLPRPYRVEDDEAISQSSTEGDAINFNENRSFLDDEFLKPRSKVTKCSGYIEYFSYIPAYENITPTNSLILQDSVSPEEPHVFTSADNHPALNDQVHTESADNLLKFNTMLSLNQSVIWSREKHIELVNRIGEPLATTRSRVRDSETTSANECLSSTTKVGFSTISQARN
ncbi:hypothetical protein Tco_0729752 [Tanacetum coccineum]|uniref:Uncharacterized protein n=1 Tax=Tanacetum coccineum TaxID=301880 RepID=A0ABQ4YR07_9ASTR